MKMAMSVESVGVHSVLRDSIANSSSQENNENITNKIIAIAKKILLTKIEYEEVNNYDQSVLDAFKSKYTVLKSFSSGKFAQSENGFEKSCNQNCNAHLQNYQLNQKFLNELPQPNRILFPRDSVQVGWRSCGRKWQIGSGMMNVGNTCYLNSTLQALFHVPAMANWLISDSEHREDCRNENGMQDGCIICAIAKTLISSQISSSAIRPQLVYSRLKQICKHLIFGRQEDAHEFLRYLVEAMEKSYLQRYKNFKELDQYSKETTPLNQILGGYLKTSVRCLSCGHVSTTFQHFQDLLLDIRKPNTIEEALDGYFAKERLEDMGYKCESCKKKVSAIKQFSLERAPISLCIQLKRFSMVGTKINKYIAIRPRLDLSKYATNKNGKEMFSYKLVAMVTHLGASQHCGHYTAIGLTEQGYYQFDDSCVRSISLPNVLNTNAYIIFYELDENHTSKPVCTQVSGENNITKNIENIQNQQKGTGNANASTSFNENLNINSNGLFNSTTKFEFSANEIDAKVLNNSIVNKNSINSQLAADNLKKMKNTKKNDDENFKTSTFASTSLNCNNINSLTNKSTENCSPSNNLSTNSTKLLIHFKNSISNNDLSLSEQKPTEHRGDHSENSTIMELGESCKSFNGNSKTVNDKSINTIDSKVNENLLVIDNVTKKEEKPFDEFNNSSLPNMPKIDSNCEISTTSVDFGYQSKKSPIKQNISWIGPLSPNFVLKQNSPNCIEIKTITVHNGNKTSHIKSLVPYGYDADEDLSNDSSDYEILNVQTGLEVKNNSGKEFIKFNGDIEKENFSTSNETSPDGSPETKRIKSNTPSPHVVKTKAGFWQVTPITPNGSPKAEIFDKMQNPGQSFSNPFVVSIPPSSFYSDKTFTNDNNIHIKRDEKCSTVKELTKFSHRGYGASVLSWNGTKSEMELVVNEEVREERKRHLEDDEENDIDRGRQKKTKNNGNHKQSDLNPGYNPFQEQQLQKYNEHNRPNWKTCNSNNRTSNKINLTNRYNNYQNNFNSNYNNFDSNNSINYINKTMNGKNNNIINNKNSNKFNIINKNNSLNNSKNNHNHKSINNSKNIKNNGKINNCFYRTDVSNHFNDNINNNDNGNKNGYSQYNPFLNRNGNSNFFRRHNSKKFNSNRIHQKNGDWR